jgi:hypothetical protein
MLSLVPTEFILSANYPINEMWSVGKSIAKSRRQRDGEEAGQKPGCKEKP